MKLRFITQKYLDDSIGIKMPRIWRFWSITGIHSNPCADPTEPYDRVYIARCPWFSVALMLGKQ